MDRIRYYVDVTAFQMKLAVMTMLEYPANFIGWLLSNPIQFLVGFGTLKFVVQEFGSINGWDYGQLAFLYGLAVMSHALSMLFFVQGWFMGYYVIEGEFDRFLLRPLSVLYQFFFTQFNINGLTDLIPGMIVFAYGCKAVDFSWNIRNVVSLLVILAGATLIRGGIYIMMGTLSFWTKSTNDFAGFTQEFFDKTTMYPLSMYPRAMQLLLTYLIPIGFISFYPAGELLSGMGSGGLLTMGIGVGLIFVAGMFFKMGLRGYESAGH